jgi:hypothetical protein
MNGKPVEPHQSGLDFSGKGPLIPAGAVVDQPITVKSTFTGATFTGSLDDLLATMRNSK